MKGTKSDCVHYVGTGGYPCNALRGLYCKAGEPCSFYKTADGFCADKAEAENRYFEKTGETASEYLARKEAQEQEERDAQKAENGHKADRERAQEKREAKKHSPAAIHIAEAIVKGII